MKVKKLMFDLERSDINDLSTGVLISEKVYNDENTLISEKLESNYSDNTGKLFWLCKYENGVLVEKKLNSNYDKNQTFLYEYDKDGRLLREFWYNKPVFMGIGYEDDTPLIKNYRYNNLGQLVEKICDHRDVRFYERWTYEYDINNNLIREVGYKSSGEIHYSLEYEYDDKNNNTKVSQYRKGELEHLITYEYNEKNQMTLQHTHTVFKSIVRFEYDEFGLCKESLFNGYVEKSEPEKIILVVREPS